MKDDNLVLGLKRLSGSSVIIGQILVIGVIVSMTRAFALTSLFEFLLLILFLSNRKLRSRFLSSFCDSRVLIPMLFWGWILLSGVWSIGETRDWLEDFWSWRKLLLVPYSFVLFENNRSKNILLWSLVAIASIFMVASWLGFLGLITLDRPPEHLLENHATQGVIFTTSAAIIFLSLNAHSKRFFLVLAILLIMGFLANNIFISTGRSAYLFMLVVVTILVFKSIHSKRKWLYSGLVAMTMIIVLGSVDRTSSRIQQAFNEVQTVYDPDEQYTSLGIRVIMWTNSLEIVKKHMLLGTGAGGYRAAYTTEVAGVEGWRGKIVDDPHQQYLHIASEYGLVGLTLFLLCLVAILAGCVSTNTRHTTLILCVLAGTVANGFANGHFSAFVEGRLFWVLCLALQSGTKDPLFEFLRSKVRRFSIQPEVKD